MTISGKVNGKDYSIEIEFGYAWCIAFWLFYIALIFLMVSNS